MNDLILLAWPFIGVGFILLACWGTTAISRRREKDDADSDIRGVVKTDGSISFPDGVRLTPLMPAAGVTLLNSLVIVNVFGAGDRALSMEELKTLNRARDVVDQSANLLIGREPKKFGGRHG